MSSLNRVKHTSGVTASNPTIPYPLKQRNAKLKSACYSELTIIRLPGTAARESIDTGPIRSDECLPQKCPLPSKPYARHACILIMQNCQEYAMTCRITTSKRANAQAPFPHNARTSKALHIAMAADQPL
jgi:hypothetical protein